MESERVIQIGTLAAFIAEVPCGPVRLNLTARNGVSDGRFQIPHTDLELSLQGINSRDEIVWLMWSYRVSFPGEEFMNPKGHAIYRLMPDMRDRVEAWLIARGYEVLSGQYALPANVSPIRGSFECVKFVPNGDDGYRLEEA